MKIKIVTSRDLSRFTSRHVRNFIGSIANKDDKDFLMHHGKGLSSVIYTKPFRNSFEIIFTKTDNKSIDVILNIREILLGDIKFYGEKIKSLTEDWSDYNPVPVKGLFIYKTLTPFILATNNTEFKILFNVAQKKDKSDFIRFISRRILSSIDYQIKEYIGKNIKLALDLDIKVIDNNNLCFKNIYYKEKILPAINFKFICNYKLPEFVGYKIGLGYGRIQEIYLT
jgi:hypothetical protein